MLLSILRQTVSRLGAAGSVGRCPGQYSLPCRRTILSFNNADGPLPDLVVPVRYLFL